MRRLLALVLGGAALAVTPGVALASGHAKRPATNQPGSPCSSPVISAANQYCENIPGAAGPQTPGPGSPSLVAPLTTAPTGSPVNPTSGGSGAVTRKPVTRKHVHLVRATLPAAGPRLALPPTPVAVNAGLGAVSDLAIVMAALAAAIGGTAIVRSRRNTAA